MKTYGLIGYPVQHSRSPAMHNAAFKALGIDAEYKLFEVRPEELEGFFPRLKGEVSGINVTIPHKEKAMDHVDVIDERAKFIGAINTVVSKDGKLIGYNTDTIGFLRALKEDLGVDPRSKKALILGAGGASRAVAFSLALEGAKRIVVIDIDLDKAAGLVKDLKASGAEAVALESSEAAKNNIALDSDILVNATPCGMKEGDHELVDPKYLHGDLVVFDLIYNPIQTRLVRDAKEKGIKAANGLGMLIYQGAAAFTLWTGKEAPVDVMREVLG